MSTYENDGGIDGVGPLSPFLVGFLESSEEIKLVLGHVIDQDGKLRMYHPDVQNAIMEAILPDLTKRLKKRYAEDKGDKKKSK